MLLSCIACCLGVLVTCVISRLPVFAVFLLAGIWLIVFVGLLGCVYCFVYSVRVFVYLLVTCCRFGCCWCLFSVGFVCFYWLCWLDRIVCLCVALFGFLAVVFLFGCVLGLVCWPLWVYLLCCLVFISLVLVLWLGLRDSLVDYWFGVVLKLGLVGLLNRLLLFVFDCCDITLIVYLFY